MSRRSQRASEEYILDIRSAAVPVKVFYEYRRDVRVALGNDCVRLRIPRHCSSTQRTAYKDWCRTWVVKQWDKNPRFRSTFTSLDILSLDSFSTFDKSFRLAVEFTSNKHAYGQIKDDTFYLEIPASFDRKSASEAGYKLIHKLLAKEYLSDFTNRVFEIHNGNFAKPIASIKLKNMSSKWGSCSHTGRMSFSTRLLFAPVDVQDYVIIHELCHLNELNHSGAFWELVEERDGSYKDKERWLRESGHLCDIGLEFENVICGYKAQ